MNTYLTFGVSTSDLCRYLGQIPYVERPHSFRVLAATLMRHLATVIDTGEACVLWWTKGRPLRRLSYNAATSMGHGRRRLEILNLQTKSQGRICIRFPCYIFFPKDGIPI